MVWNPFKKKEKQPTAPQSIADKLEKEIDNLPDMFKSQLKDPAVKERFISIARRMEKDGVNFKSIRQMKKWMKDHEVELASVWLGVNLLDRREKYQIHTCLCQHRCISLRCARVVFEVVLVVELCWVYEYACYNDVALLASTRNERDMTFVQCAHCWHKTYLFTLAFVELLSQCLYC